MGKRLRGGKRSTKGRDDEGYRGNRSRLVILFSLIGLALVGAAFVLLDFEKRWGLFDLKKYLTIPDTILPQRQVVAESGSTTAIEDDQQQQSSSLEPLHVLYGVSGKNPNFFLEFEVSLRSVLMNAPINRPLEIHVMTDEDAHDFLTTKTWQKVFFNNQTIPINTTTILDTHKTWYTDVTITTYNVQSFLSGWKGYVQGHTAANMVLTHTIGAYFRLFSHHVLPSSVKQVLYMDTDVVVCANLNQAVEQDIPADDKDWIFIMQDGCSGLMVINLLQLDTFWKLILGVIWQGRQKRNADQDLILAVRNQLDDNRTKDGITDPSTKYIRAISKPWDLVFARDFVIQDREKLLEFRPQLGAVHYSGGGDGKNAFYQQNVLFLHENKRNSWGLVGAYYIDLPWSWAFYIGQSMAAAGNERTGTANNDKKKKKGTIRIQDFDVTPKLKGAARGPLSPYISM